MNEKDLVKWINELIEKDELWRFYKSSEFMRLREEVLREQHYECQICRAEGKIVKATIVHHIYHVRDYPQYALSKYVIDENGEKQKNLISVCLPCHNRVHTEKGGNHTEKSKSKKSTLYIVTGLPGAGKTTYVQSHMKDSDVVYDLDYIANAISYDKNNYYSRNLANKLLSSFVKEASKLNTDTYIIRSIPSKEELELFEKYNAVYIDIKEDTDVCYERRKDVISKDKFDEKIFRYNVYLNNKNNSNKKDMEERW